MRCVEPEAIAQKTEKSPAVVPSRTTALLARVWPDPKLIALVAESSPSDGNIRRLPGPVDPVTATLTATAFAVAGMPQ